ncbi:cytochrome P450 [Algicella marina]|nr:cytochrome P450 [Algicella marina]
MPATTAPLVDPAILAQAPHNEFAALRPHHAVISLGERQYMALRATDVQRLLKDDRTIQVEGSTFCQLQSIPDGATRRLLSDFFLLSNGKPHRDRRGLFARTFAYSAMQSETARIRSIADQIVFSLPRNTSFDFVDTMAAQVPAKMTAALLGLPEVTVPYFTHAAYSISRAVSPIYPIDIHGEIEQATSELFGFVEDQLHERIQTPKDDLLTGLVADWQEHRNLSFESLVHQILGLIVGGTDTTRAAFAVLVYLLLERPDQWQAVQSDPSLIPGAVAEALRYEPSVGSITRFTVVDIQIGDTMVPKGSLLRLSTMSAMRDPALYADPERFDIRREDHPRLHTVFGDGPHRCIGEMLARIELQESLTALIAGAPGITLEAPPQLIGFGGIRQITPMITRIPA